MLEAMTLSMPDFVPSSWLSQPAGVVGIIALMAVTSLVLYVIVLLAILLLHIATGAASGPWVWSVLRMWKPVPRFFCCCRCCCKWLSGHNPCTVCIRPYSRKHHPKPESVPKDDSLLLEPNALQSDAQAHHRMQHASLAQMNGNNSQAVQASNISKAPRRSSRKYSTKSPVSSDINKTVSAPYPSLPQSSAQGLPSSSTNVGKASSSGWLAWKLTWSHSADAAMDSHSALPDTEGGPSQSAQRNVPIMCSPIQSPRRSAEHEGETTVWWSSNAYGLPFSGISISNLVADMPSDVYAPTVSRSCGSTHQTLPISRSGKSGNEISQSELQQLERRGHPSGPLPDTVGLPPPALSASNHRRDRAYGFLPSLVKNQKLPERKKSGQGQAAPTALTGTQKLGMQAPYFSKRRDQRQPPKLYDKAKYPSPGQITKLRVEQWVEQRAHATNTKHKAQPQSGLPSDKAFRDDLDPATESARHAALAFKRPLSFSWFSDAVGGSLFGNATGTETASTEDEEDHMLPRGEAQC